MLLCILQKLCERAVLSRVLWSFQKFTRMEEVLLHGFWRMQSPWKSIFWNTFKNVGLVKPGVALGRLQEPVNRKRISLEVACSSSWGVLGNGSNCASQNCAATQKGHLAPFPKAHKPWGMVQLARIPHSAAHHLPSDIVVFLLMGPCDLPEAAPGRRRPFFLKQLQRMLLCTLCSSKNHVKAYLILAWFLEAAQEHRFQRQHKSTPHFHTASKNHLRMGHAFENCWCWWWWTLACYSKSCGMSPVTHTSQGILRA